VSPELKREMEPQRQPLPLRLGPTLAGAMLAIAVGSLLFSACSLALHGPGSSMIALAGTVASWIFTAGCVYAANQQWLGRAVDEQAERFVICLFVSIPIVPVTILATSGLYEVMGR